MSTTTRRFGTATVVGLLALVGAAGCGGSPTPAAPPTTPPTPTTTSPSPTPTPTPEPPGPMVVAVRALSDGSRVLVAYDLDEGTTRRLSTLEPTDNSPGVDAAGTSVVVAHYPVGPNEENPSDGEHCHTSHLVVIDLDTGDRKPLTASREGRADQYPQWNRAGDGWVYFQRSDCVEHTTGLWRADPDTGEVEPVPNGSGVIWGRFALEPGGDSVWVNRPYCGTAFPCDGNDWRLDLTTGTVSRHPFDEEDTGEWIGGVAWTPDGAWFAYTWEACDVDICHELVVHRWPDGTPRTVLTDEEATGPHRLTGPVAWHPDGDSVLVLATVTPADGAGPPASRILLVDTSDGSATTLGPATGDDLAFDVWAPPADG